MPTPNAPTPHAPTPNAGPTAQQSIEAATVACSQWGIAPESVEILNQTENIVLAVELVNRVMHFIERYSVWVARSFSRRKWSEKNDLGIR